MLIWLLAMLEDEEDRALFTRLHEKYEGKMYAVALSILKEHHLAEDCVHDAFCAIIQNFLKNFVTFVPSELFFFIKEEK